MKYALVTGSTRGIGYAIAKKLAENGYFLFVNGVNSHSNDCPNSMLINADLSTMEGAEKLINIVLSKTNTLDCLVLNAGATCRTPFGEVKYDEWQRVMNTNVNIPFFIVQQLRNYIAFGGNILFISSAMALKPHATSIAYGVSKAAVNLLAQSLVKEFANREIRVNAICPGFIDTDWQKEKPEWLRNKIENKIALNRFGTPDEIADFCWSIIVNGYVNGSILSIDGGYCINE